MPSVAAAAHNNAAWCNAVCRAQGLPTQMDGALWRCEGPPPRFYPNAVTLTAHAQAAQLAAIAALAAGAPADEISVKDSFAALELGPLGFDLLFTSTWVARAARAPRPGATDRVWARVHTPAQLARWEAAWGAQARAPEVATFQPALLRDADICILAATRGGTIVAGGILNRTATRAGVVVGISNAFAAPHEDGAACWSDLAAQAAVYSPGCPIVGYETGAPLAWALDAGFLALHPLRIWARRGAS